MSTTRAGRKQAPPKARAVSRPHDPAEVQADKAADVVARGGSVSGWSFGSVPVDAGVHREDKGKPTDEDKLKEAAKKTGEAVLETEAGKKLQEKVKETPLVKEATKFLDTTAGKVVAGTAIAGVAAGVVGGSAAAKKPLPFQAPAIPLDKITPGLSANVTVDGPVNAPTFVGLSLTYKEQGPKPKAKDNSTIEERAAAIRAQGRAQADMFKPQAQKDAEKAEADQAAIAYVVALQKKQFGTSPLLPLGPSDKPKTVEVPKDQPAEQKKEKDEAPVQREPATDTASESAVDTSGVDDAVRGGGRPLDPSTRRSMEARFGYDFSGVRIHDDAGASSAAAQVDANAFTVGEDIVFGTGGFDPSTPQGRHLLAHELAHVVQQRGHGPGAGAEHLHRRSIFESIGIWLGLAEGTWSDQELYAYLDEISANGKLDGSYDADNKARAIVQKWKRGTPGWELDAWQKALLIDEMLDGPTLDDDEQCILDLLELSDEHDLRVIFAYSPKRIADLESDLDGEERHRLDAFVARRFDGGSAALKAGTVKIVGASSPPGAPSFTFSGAAFDVRLENTHAAQMVTYIDHLAPSERAKAIDHLLKETWPRSQDELGQLRVDGADLKGDAKERNTERQGVLKLRIERTEKILHHFFASDAFGSEAALAAGTHAIGDSKRFQELRDVLRPKQFMPTAKTPASTVPPPTPNVKPVEKLAEKPSEKPSEKPDETTEKVPDKLPAPPVPEVPKSRFHHPSEYEKEVRKALPDLIKAIYQSQISKSGARADVSELERIAAAAKDEVDGVFDHYYDKSVHHAMVVDKPGQKGNLHRWYEEASSEIDPLGENQRKEMAIRWAKYYFQSQEAIRLINEKHLANPKYDGETPKNDEATILETIAKWAANDATMRTQLIEARRNWRGMASGDTVWVELYHDPDAERDRRACWRMFQTLSHEYMHTLRNEKYTAYARDSFGHASAEWNTLVEGVDEVLSLSVWAKVRSRVRDKILRTKVEGPAHAELEAITPGEPSHYASYDEAMRLTTRVGFANLCAAYFLGLVDRISAPDPAAKNKGSEVMP